MGISKQDMIAQIDVDLEQADLIESEYEQERDPHFFFDEYDASENGFDEDDFDEEEQIEDMIDDEERAANFVYDIVEAYKSFAKAFPELDAEARKADGDSSFEQTVAGVEEVARFMSRYI